MFPKPSQPDFKLSPGQELLHFICHYIHSHLDFPPAPNACVHAPSPLQPDTGSGSSCRFELASFHITFGIAGNFASLYVGLVSALISEIKGLG